MKRHRVIVALVTVLGAILCFPSEGLAQSRLGVAMSRGYSIGQLLGELRAVDCSPPPDALATAFLDYQVEWLSIRMESRTELDHAIPGGYGILQGVEATKRAIRVIERAREREDAIEDKLFSAIAAATPECAESIGQVRTWRRTVNAMPKGPQVIQCFDMGRNARWLQWTPETRRAVFDALAPSEATRRAAFERLQKSLFEGEIAAAKLVDEAGAVGLNEFGEEARRLGDLGVNRYRALNPDPKAVADVMEAELGAYRAIEPLLTPGAKRNIVDIYLTRLSVMRGAGPFKGLPEIGVQLSNPADVGKLVLAWRDLPRDKRKATREALIAWIKESDALLFAHLDEEIAALRAVPDFRSLHNPYQMGNDPWEQLAKKHIPLIVTASGATWLNSGLDPANGAASVPPLDDRDYDDDDVVVTSDKRAWIAQVNRDTSEKRVSELLPAPIDDATKSKLFAALELNDERRLVVEELLARHASEWAKVVEPPVEEARGMQAKADRLDLLEGPAIEELSVQASAADAARRKAFNEAQRIDDELFTSIAAVLDDAHRNSLLRVRASREIASVLARAGSWASNVNRVSLEGIGGTVFDYGAPLDDATITPAVRRAAEDAVNDRWPMMVELARDTREMQLQAMLAGCLDRLKQSRTAEGLTAEEKAAHKERVEREATLVDRWRREGDAVMAIMLDAVEKAKLEGAPLRFAFERRRFPWSYTRANEYRTLMEKYADLPDFEGKEALGAKLVALQEPIERLARDSAARCMPLRSLREVDEFSAMQVGRLNAMIRSDILDVSGSLLGLAPYLLAKGAPSEVIEANPYFVGMIRGYLN